MSLAYIYFTFSAALNALVSTYLGFLILFKDRRNKINITLSLFSFAVALWSYAYILWPLAITREQALLSFQLLHIPACFVSIFYLHFVVDWLGIYKKRRPIIIIGYILSIFFGSSTFSSLFIKDMIPRFSMRYWAVPGPLYAYYLLMFFGLFLYSSYLLLTNYFREKGTRRVQILLILVGIGLSFIGGSTNYFLWYNINIPPYGNILASSFVVFTVYAIVRYNLLNIKLIATEATLLVMNVLLLFRFIISRSIGEFILNTVILIGSLILSAILISSVRREIKRREELERLSRALEEANEKLKEMDRAKTDFLSIASHQLRSPMTVIKVGVGAILDGVFGPMKEKKQIDALNKILENAERLIDLIGDYLNISRIEMGRLQYTFKEVNVCGLAKETVEEYKQRASVKGLTLTFKGAQKVPVAVCDEEKIREVISNIVDNAIKYTPSGSIDAHCEYLTKEKMIKMWVKDTGLGLSSEEMKIIFQKFRRAGQKNLRRRDGEPIEGSGLGLYVAKMFLEAHGGKIWSESEGKGKGSTFAFVLPLKPKTPPAPAAPASPTPTPVTTSTSKDPAALPESIKNG